MIDCLSAVNVGRRFYNLMIKGKDYEDKRVELFRKYKAPTALAITLDKKQKKGDGFTLQIRNADVLLSCVGRRVHLLVFLHDCSDEFQKA